MLNTEALFFLYSSIPKQKITNQALSGEDTVLMNLKNTNKNAHQECCIVHNSQQN